MTSVVVEQFHAPDTRRGERMLELVRRRAVEQLAGRRSWLIDAGPTAPTRPERARVDEADGEAIAMQPISSQAGESLLTLIALHVRAGDVVVIRDSAAMGVSRLVRERGAHVVWDRRVSSPASRSASDWARRRPQAPAFDAWLTAWTSGRGRAPRRMAAFIGAPGILSARELCAGAPGDSYEQLGWTSLLADVVREDRADRVGGRLTARPFVAPR